MANKPEDLNPKDKSETVKAGTDMKSNGVTSKGSVGYEALSAGPPSTPKPTMGQGQIQSKPEQGR